MVSLASDARTTASRHLKGQDFTVALAMLADLKGMALDTPSFIPRHRGWHCWLWHHGFSLGSSTLDQHPSRRDSFYEQRAEGPDSAESSSLPFS